MGHRVVAAQVHRDDRVPLLGRHLHQGAVAQDAGVVDQSVETAELLDRGLHQPVRDVDVTAVTDARDGRAAGRR